MLIIGIAGPAGGGKTTFAKSLVDALPKSIAIHYEMSQLLRTIAGIFTEETPHRAVLIQLGDLLRDCNSGILVDHAFRNISMYDVAVVTGIMDINEWRELAGYADDNRLLIHYDIHTQPYNKLVSPGDIYPNDCRRNLANCADFINPPLNMIVREVLDYLEKERGKEEEVEIT